MGFKRNHARIAWVVPLLSLFLLPLPCRSETYEWEDYRLAYAMDISLSNPAEVNVRLPAEMLQAVELLLSVDVALTSGYGAVYLSVNDNQTDRLLVARDESLEAVVRIPAAALKPGMNKLLFYDEKGFAGNMIRRLAFNLPGQAGALTPPAPTEKTLPTIPEASRAKIAVIQFEALNPKDGEKGLGLMVSEMFTTELVNVDAYKIIEREQLNKVLAELSLAQSGVLASADVQKIGKILEIDALVTGSVINIGDMLRIDSRVIDVANGMILAAESRVVKLDLKEMESGVREMVLAVTLKYYRKDSALWD